MTIKKKIKLFTIIPSVVGGKYLYLYNNTPNNNIVNAVSNISYRPLIQVCVFAVLFMNELKNLTDAVIGKLGKLVHKQNIYRYFCFIL